MATHIRLPLALCIRAMSFAQDLFPEVDFVEKDEVQEHREYFGRKGTGKALPGPKVSSFLLRAAIFCKRPLPWAPCSHLVENESTGYSHRGGRSLWSAGPLQQKQLQLSLAYSPSSLGLQTMAANHIPSTLASERHGLVCLWS